MWSRSAKSKETGKFAVECIDWDGNLFFSGEFDNARDADRAGEDAERRMTMKMMPRLTLQAWMTFSLRWTRMNCLRNCLDDKQSGRGSFKGGTLSQQHAAPRYQPRPQQGFFFAHNTSVGGDHNDSRRDRKGNDLAGA